MRYGVLLVVPVSLLLAACGGSNGGADAAGSGEVAAALEARLVDRNLSYDWVVCVRTSRSFAGNPIFRCNVNFGEPHIVRYCATLEADDLLTNREQPDLRCGREVQGSRAEASTGSRHHS